MEDLFTLNTLWSLLALTVMEILLGIDNVIFVSIILNRLNKNDTKKARLIWMVIGVTMRLLFLYILGHLIKGEFELFKIMDHSVALKDVIMLGGGLFLLVNSTLEIHNNLEGEEKDEVSHQKGATFKSIITQMILVDMVFSIDGVITAIGMSNHLAVMMAAVVASMCVMFYFAPKISAFIMQHPTFKILALSFLVLIAVLLVVEGVHVEEIHIPKGYIYFAMAFSFSVELINLQIRKKTNPVELRKPKLDESEENS